MLSPYKYLDGMPDPWESQPAAASLSAKVGSALKLSSGQVALCGATDKPEFICMQDVTSASAGDPVHVIRVNERTIYETTLSVASASIAAGTSYTLTTVADTEITATATSGVAKVLDWDGEAAGDKVRVMF